jgi:hypothetical protein
MSTGTHADRLLKGHRLGDGAGDGRVYRDALLKDGPLELDRFDRPLVEPQLVLALGADVPPGSSPGAALLAVAGVFGCLEFSDDANRAYLLGGRMHDRWPHGELSLYVGDRLAVTRAVDDLAEVGALVVRLADRLGGLADRQLLFGALTGPAVPVPVTAGVVELWGPGTSVLTTSVEGVRGA